MASLTVKGKQYVNNNHTMFHLYANNKNVYGCLVQNIHTPKLYLIYASKMLWKANIFNVHSSDTLNENTIFLAAINDRCLGT